MSKKVYYSFEALEKLKKELLQLTSVERPSISRQIAEARDKGDLSENAEYDAAKEAQGLLEMKISSLEHKISCARVIDASKLADDKVLLYSTVQIKNTLNGHSQIYTLVPESEADISQKKISISSPISVGILGKKVGDFADISVPSGKIKFEILKISRD